MKKTLRKIRELLCKHADFIYAACGLWVLVQLGRFIGELPLPPADQMTESEAACGAMGLIVALFVWFLSRWLGFVFEIIRDAIRRKCRQKHQEVNQ